MRRLRRVSQTASLPAQKTVLPRVLHSTSELASLHSTHVTPALLRVVGGVVVLAIVAATVTGADLASVGQDRR